MGKIFADHTSVTGVFNPKYTKNSYSSIAKKKKKTFQKNLI